MSQAQAAAMIAAFLGAMQQELASNGKFVIRGIGTLEVVPNIPKSPSRVFGGVNATHMPVRIAFRTSRKLKGQIARAYGLGNASTPEASS